MTIPAGHRTPAQQRAIARRRNPPKPAPRPATCPRCGAATLHCHIDTLDHDLDAQPLTRIGELDALLRGHRTYQLSPYAISYRSAYWIKTIPAPAIGRIHRTHQCGATPVRTEHIKPADPPPPTECPF